MLDLPSCIIHLGKEGINLDLGYKMVKMKLIEQKGKREVQKDYLLFPELVLWVGLHQSLFVPFL